MKSFKQYITEVFDKPYKWRGGRLAKGVIAPNNDGIPEDYVFKTCEGEIMQSLKSFKTFLKEGAGSKGEQMEYAIVSAINGNEEPQEKIILGSGKKVVDSLKLKGKAKVLGGGTIEVTKDWSQYWEGCKVPSSTKTPKTDFKVEKQKISLKTGGDAQLMSGGRNESKATFYAAVRNSKAKPTELLGKIECAMNELVGHAQTDDYLKSKIKDKTDEAVNKANKAHKVIQNDLRKLFASDSNFTYAFCYEAMTGDVKFGGNDGTCTHFLTCTFKGEDAHLIPVSNKSYVNKIANRVGVSVRFKSSSQSKTIDGKKVKTGKRSYWSVVGLLVSKLNEEIENVDGMLTEGVLKNIISRVKAWWSKQWQSIKEWISKSWMNLLEFLGIEPVVSFKNKIEFTP